MRSYTGTQGTLFRAAIVQYHVKLEVTNASGTWKEVTNLGGVNYFKSASISCSLDDPVQSATFVLKRNDGSSSLAPLMSGSGLNVDDTLAYAPLLMANRRIRFSVAMTAPGGTPSEWKVIFYGKIDGVSHSDGRTSISVRCRDMGAYLLDNVIDLERKYSDSVGVPVESVMQQILDDNMTLVNLVTPVSPSWYIKQYLQSKVSVLQALRDLAQQIAWDVRYEWDAADTFALRFYEPDRAKVVADYTFDASEYKDIPVFEFDDEAIRNFIRVWFTDRILKKRVSVTVYDLTSIADFGRRYMELAEEPTSNIDSTTEATLMAQGALDDLTIPMFSKQVETKLFWAAQLGDLYAFLSNAVHYDSTQQFAVVGYTHTLEGGRGNTTLQLRGKPAGAFRDWLRKERYPNKDTFYPAPTFSVLLGEESSMGGYDNDGMVWLIAQFEPNTSYIKIYAEEAPTDAVPMPDVTEITTAWTIFRPEGDIGANDFFTTFVGLATRPGQYKRVRCIGYNEKDLAGPEWTPPPVAALDNVPAYVDGEITDFTLSVLPSGNGYRLTVDVGAIDATANSYVMVMRNGLVVLFHWLMNVGNQTVIIDDPGLNLTSEYTYKVFIWTAGQTGPAWMWVNGVVYPPGTGSNPNTPTAYPAPAFANGTPKMGTHVITGVPTIDVDWTLADAGAAFVYVETSFNGSSWSILATFGGSPPLVGGLQTDIIADQWFRLRASDGAGSTRGISQPVYFQTPVVIGPPPPPPPITGGTLPNVNTPKFVNNTPRYDFTGSTGVYIEWACPDTVPASIDIESSPDNVTWSNVTTSASVASGGFYHVDTTAKYYRLRTHTAGVTRYVSGSAWFPGPSAPPLSGNAYPDFTLTPHTSPTWQSYILLAWTCSNNNATSVAVEESDDDGATDPWALLNSYAAVASGSDLLPIGPAKYYRMVAYQGATVIAVSPSQFWTGTPV